MGSFPARAHWLQVIKPIVCKTKEILIEEVAIMDFLVKHIEARLYGIWSSIPESKLVKERS